MRAAGSSAPAAAPHPQPPTMATPAQIPALHRPEGHWSSAAQGLSPGRGGRQTPERQKAPPVQSTSAWQAPRQSAFERRV